MAYKLKYYYNFTDIEGNKHLVELLQNTLSPIASQEVKSGKMPFMTKTPKLDHKFQPVRGRGCELNLISEENFDFFEGLYHVDAQEFMIKHYINNNINYLGYLNPEIFREQYFKNKNYPVQVTGNDGFALTDRFFFLDNSENKFTGVKSFWEILQIILEKINLPWEEVNISLSTTSPEFLIAENKNLLHYVYIDCSNFYDEDDQPLTLREVLESILKPFAAFIYSERGKIFITDINNLALNEFINFKRFKKSDYTYIDDVSVYNRKKISDIGFKGTGQEIEISGGKNKQVVVYSPYAIDTTIIEKSINNTDEFENIGNFEVYDGYYRRPLSVNKYWDVQNYGSFEESYADDPSKTNIYLKIDFPLVTDPPAPFLNVLSSKFNRYLNINSSTDAKNKVAIKTDFEILALQRDLSDPSKSVSPYNFTGDSFFLGIGLNFWRLSIGYLYCKTFNITNPTWTTSVPEVDDNRVIIKNNNGLDKGWTKVSELWGCEDRSGVNQALNGNFSLDLFSSFYAFRINQRGEFIDMTDKLHSVWIKNFQISIVDIKGEKINDNDVEYIGLLDERFKEQGDTINLYCGTESKNIDRGKIMKKEGLIYSPIQTWTRRGQTYKIEELLLGSLSSNFRKGFISLSKMKLSNKFNLYNIMIDDGIEGKRLMVNEGKTDYYNCRTECGLIEISDDDLTIIK